MVTREDAFSVSNYPDLDTTMSALRDELYELCLAGDIEPIEDLITKYNSLAAIMSFTT
jgi:hypothetical protein